MKSIIIFCLMLVTANLFAQNQANIWYFGSHCGLDLNSGVPIVIYDGQSEANLGNSTISDSSGNLLFYSAEYSAYNKQHEIMQNGDDLMFPGTFGRTIVNWPGHENLYFIFTARHPQINLGFYYSVVDMSLDNSLGAITEKDIPVTAAMDAADRIAIVRQDNSENVWVITRKFWDDQFAAFLINENGFNPNPVLSNVPYQYISAGNWGYLKVSYDKKYIISNYSANADIEVCSFDASNGTIDYMYSLFYPGGVIASLSGMEFSPDSRYLYLGYMVSNDSNMIYQFDMQFINDIYLFNNSGMLVGIGGNSGMQLARDGMIYCAVSEHPDPYYHLSVIQKPWVRGPGCSYVSDVIYTYPGEVGWSLPNILLDYLYRFEWKGDQCQGSPMNFIPNFIPPIDSIKWVFEAFAPGSYSEEFSPVYAFQTPGIHEVQVDVWYSSGRFEHTSREIEIFPAPQPDLGPDTLICEGNSVTLYANCTADLYSWSTEQFGSPEITVSDSGAYWVKASFNETGCKAYDTIHVGFYPPIQIDETGLVITPTSCNGANGSITGLYALGSMPLVFQWKDLSGNVVSTGIDVFNLPAGQYFLTITDANQCQTTSGVYTIEDAGNLQVLEVDSSQPHCFRPDGQIVVHAYSPSGSTLEFSIDDGVTYQSDSVFSGLIGASYVVRVKDGNGCEGFYLSNPVLLNDIPGPQVTEVNVTDETDFLGNGIIEIVASGSTSQLFYSIDSGNTWQLNNGTFENVVCNMYYVVIRDGNGCDTSFTVEVQNIILTYLQAVTGPGEQCMGDAVTIPIEVENFKSVAAFRLQLSFNEDNLQCEGYASIHPQLHQNLTAWVDQAAGEITFQWQDTVALTFDQQDTVAELVFTTRHAGSGDIGWYTGTTESYFANLGGSAIPAEFHTGEVIIYEPPKIILANSKTICEGQMLSLMSIAIGNHPPFTYRWIYPTGDTSTSYPFFFSITLAEAGDYTLLATDAMHCTDQKSIHIEVSENPVAAFHGTDTLEMHQGDVLDAGAGMESYRWNNGDTLKYTIVEIEGMYSVEMESLSGCLGRDSIYIKLTSDGTPSDNIFIPNAFSPDGDGLNDVFMAVATSDYIRTFHMLIFDRWGGQIFESNDIFSGWDGTMHGKPLPGGMYTYKITYSIYPSRGDYSKQVRLGTVMLVR